MSKALSAAGTERSNLICSSEESANHWFLSGGPITTDGSKDHDAAAHAPPQIHRGLSRLRWVSVGGRGGNSKVSARPAGMPGAREQEMLTGKGG